jgi:hypothetical protein
MLIGMWPLAPLLLLILAACGAQPAPQMFGAERFTASRAGHDYVLYRKGNLFEIIRLGYVRPGGHQAVRATMLALVPELTGCTPLDGTVTGDSGEMRGRLRCPRGG